LDAHERAAAAAPDDPDAWGRLATVRAATGDAPGALAAAARALDLAPLGWQGWLARGQARHALGDLALARHDLAVAEALCPVDPTPVLLARADLAEAEGDLPLARELCALARALGLVGPEHGAALDARLARLAERGAARATGE
ncbi:MAG: hypothetical protein M9894_31100, partial [Planctomycetes bacterium]|nr:hypothetical protein [Planctomycetota bacterium]